LHQSSVEVIADELTETLKGAGNEKRDAQNEKAARQQGDLLFFKGE
jgi:hypothetical protein